MALTKISTGGVKDDTADEAKLKVSNAGTNGQFLQKQSGNTGGLTWAAANEYTHPNHSGEVTSTADGAQVIASEVVDEDNLKISNAGTNGQYLQKQSGNTGGLTWADVNIPASGNTFTATADGAIANNKPVKLNTNGTVAQIKNIVTAHSNPVISPSTTTSDVGKKITTSTPRYQQVVWDANHKIFISLYAASADGNVHGHIITPGADGASSPAVSANFDLQTNNNCWGIGSDFDPVNNYIVTFFNNNAGSGSVRYFRTKVTDAATLTPTAHNSTSTSTTASSEVEGYETGQSDQYTPAVRYIGNGRFAAVWHIGQGPAGAPGDRDSLQVGIWEWNSSNSTYTKTTNDTLTSENDPGTYYDIAKIADDKFVVIWKGDDNKGHYRVCSYSSNSITFGTAGKFADYTLAGVGNPSVAYDETAGKVLFVWQKDSNNDQYFSSVGTVSGNNISLGSEVAVNSANSETPAGQNSTYHGKIFNTLLYIPANEKISFTGTIEGHQNNANTKVITQEATISGTSVSWSTGYDVQTTAMKLHRLASAASNLEEGTLLHHYMHTDYNWNHCKQVTYNSVATNLTADEQYLGFADAAYTNGQTATIKTVGNNVSTLSGLTTGSEYYVQPNGTLATTAGPVKTYAGTALSASKLLIQPQVSEAGGWQIINSSKIETGHDTDPIITESLSDAYQLYRLQWYTVYAANSGLMGFRIKHSGSWPTSGYWYNFSRTASGTQHSNIANNNANRMYIAESQAHRICSGKMEFGNVDSTTQTKVFKIETAANNTLTGGYSAPFVGLTSAGHNSNAAITGLRFHCSAMTEGWFVLEGLKI